MTHVDILHLDGRRWMTAGFMPYQFGEGWSWIAESLAREFECSEQDVSCDDDEEIVTVRGEPVARYKLRFDNC